MCSADSSSKAIPLLVRTPIYRASVTSIRRKWRKSSATPFSFDSCCYIHLIPTQVTIAPLKMMNNYDDAKSSSQSRSNVLEIELFDISLRGKLPKVGRSSWDDFFCVRISVCNQLQTTGWALRSYKWNKTHRFKVEESSKVTFNIDACDMRQSRRIGSFEDTVERLLKCPGPIRRTVSLYGSHGQEIEIYFRIAQIQSSTINKLSISYIDLQDLPSVHHDTFRVQVAIDDTIWESPSKSSNQGRSRWTDGYDFPFQLDSHASLQIFATRWLHKNKPIAVVEGFVKDWLAAPNGVVRKTLESGGAKIQAEFKVFQTSGVSAAGNHHVEEAANSTVEQTDVPSTKPIDALDISAVILDIDRVPKFGKLSWDDRFFLEVHAAGSGGSQNITSQGQQGEKCLMWDTTFTFNVSQTSQLVFRVLGYDGKDSEPIPIGIAIFDVDELLRQNSLIRRPLLSSAASVRIEGIPTLSFRAAQAGAMSFTRSLSFFTQELSAAVNRTADLNVQPNQPRDYGQDKRIIEHAISRASRDTGGDEHLYPLLVKISIFVSVAERLAKLHPYARIAFAILATGYEVVRQKIACEFGIIRLMHTMQDTYDLVMTVDALPYLHKQKNVLEAIMQQTIECAFFIRDYVDTRGSFAQAIKNSALNMESQIKAFENAFIDLQRNFQSYMAVSTQLTVLKILEDVQDLGAKADFRDMSYAVDARCAASYAVHLPANSAAPPSDLITSLQSWVIGDSKESERICLLSGPEELCSSIALVIGEQFQFASRLGSSYCFRGTRHNDTRSYSNLFSTIARDLADRTVGNETSLRKTRVARTQFEEFILAPSRDVIWNGPFLVIIDGLELGGNEAARKEILSVLVDAGAELPRNLRFLITCRLEDDICKAFRGQSHVLRRQLGEATPLATRADNFEDYVGV
ncbi:hypothetical protein DFJ58DRAFT_777749 [Suillus subalutaceus]|uniref:uncharacterized protein n=1 Tax=Suillus subalutaceus TaxID=48586 RepID=UPI001B882416|nr:uncharacterized protein DFJ58DRAFT_777749 [Suillus subalutaceus]KAG1861121.1 hypothetical protein DFJ58DRAFT_777749 [Suillus subalutaceus]